MSDLTTEPLEQESDGRTADEVLAQELVERARAEGVELVGPGGLLTGLTKTVLETALEAELDDHLGYPKHAVEGRDRGQLEERCFYALRQSRKQSHGSPQIPGQAANGAF